MKFLIVFVVSLLPIISFAQIKFGNFASVGGASFPSVLQNEVKGGYHQVANTTAMLRIPFERQQTGMMVYVQDLQKTYRLVRVGSPSQITATSPGVGWYNTFGNERQFQTSVGVNWEEATEGPWIVSGNNIFYTGGSVSIGSSISLPSSIFNLVQLNYTYWRQSQGSSVGNIRTTYLPRCYCDLNQYVADCSQQFTISELLPIAQNNVYGFERCYDHFGSTGNYMYYGYSLTGSEQSSLTFGLSGLIVQFGGNLSSSMTLNAKGFGIGTSNPVARLHVSLNGGGNPDIAGYGGVYLFNPTNTAGQNANVTLRTAGSSAGNPYISFDVQGEQGWSAGIDNVDNAFQITPNRASLSNPALTIHPSSRNTNLRGSILYLSDKSAITSNDNRLRLNQDGAFPSGVHTPGLFAPRSLNVGGVNSWANPGEGNAVIAGNLTVVDNGTPGTNNLQVGDDSYFSDIDVAGRLGLYSTAGGGNHGGLRLRGINSIGTSEFTCTSCGDGNANRGNMTIQGRVISANNNIHFSPPNGTNVIINDDYRRAGGNGGGSAGLIVEGNVNAPAYFYSSDRRLKNNIKPLFSSLDAILKLTGYQFSWKDSSLEGIGLIAQEVELIFPQIVDINPETQMKSVQYGNLVAPLIEAIKELNSKIGQQQKEIELLKKQVSIK